MCQIEVKPHAHVFCREDGVDMINLLICVYVYIHVKLFLAVLCHSSVTYSLLMEQNKVNYILFILHS